MFGGLTLFLQNETFIKLKPTIIYVLFAATLFGGLIFRKPLLAMVFDQVFNLTEEGWRKLTIRWALFFLALAVLNEIVWRNWSTDVLGQLQGVRGDSHHLRVRGVSVSADDEIRGQARAGLGHGTALTPICSPILRSEQSEGVSKDGQPMLRDALCERSSA